MRRGKAGSFFFDFFSMIFFDEKRRGGFFLFSLDSTFFVRSFVFDVCERIRSWFLNLSLSLSLLWRRRGGME